ncbi:MAG: (Fe-S)-binding protein [Candidatus Bathyarchaeota archaeon]|nr:MAG: (Fe-S)-binding protein [Candidatus Bathyarchaeota archaeon]
MVDSFKQIAGSSNVLTDVEDTFVYSRHKLNSIQPTLNVQAVVRTGSQTQTQEIMRTCRKEGILVTQIEAVDQVIGRPPIVIVDDRPQPQLDPVAEPMAHMMSLMSQVTTGGVLNHALALCLKLDSRPASKCAECNTCSSYCTVAPSFNGIETWSAKGRIMVTRAVTGNTLPISQKATDVIFNCSLCGLCFANCLPASETHDAIRAVRHRLALQGLTPSSIEAAAGNITRVGDPSGTPPTNRLRWMKQTPELYTRRQRTKARVLYWIGCTVATRTENTPRAITRILNYGGVDFTTLGEKEGCCGYLLLATGLWEKAKANAEQLIEKVEASGADTLITSCSGCYYTFTKLFPKILNIDTPFDVFHTSQYLRNLLRDGLLHLGNAGGKRVTYHDPCSLGRHARVYEDPREVLKRIPGLRLVEMQLNRTRARCCGGGGGLWTINNKVSLQTGIDRLKADAAPLKVNSLVTGCPICQLNLRFAALRSRVPIKVLDLGEVVENALLKND